MTKTTQRLWTLKKLDVLTKNSGLTEKDAVKIGRKINQGIAKRHGINL